MQNDSLAAAKSMKDKNMRKVLVSLVQDYGHRVVATNNGHIRVLHRDGIEQVVMAGTPSDYRSHRNSLATLRRKGFEV